MTPTAVRRAGGRQRKGRRWLAAAALLLLLLGAVLAGAAGLVVWLNVRGEAPLPADGPAASAAPAPAGLVARGAYLARAGNCIGCHTQPGGALLAGGRGVETPFGTVHASNLTPHTVSGIGNWSPDAFWRALHHGRSRDGRLLYPAFPYPSYTTVTRDDADALYAYLRSVPPIDLPNTPHGLAFPYNTQAALAVWRALFFRPRRFTAEPLQGAEWNRGKYLVQGLGHCAACHASRNALGAARLNAEFAGGLMPDGAWYAPSLSSPAEAGVQRWPRQSVVQLLQTGITAHAVVTGPMAEVVYASTQHLADSDLDAMARFLMALPLVADDNAPSAAAAAAAAPETLTLGGRLYGRHCAACHGEQGQGVPLVYPPLAGNRTVTLTSPNNLVQTIRHGGFAPATAGNPQPYGMPPFTQVLSHGDIAAVATFIRQSWGNAAPAVTALDVLRVR